MRLPAGSPNPDKGLPHYTVEQLAKLDEIKDDRYELTIAQAKYVNHVLNPDGTLHGNIEKVRQAAGDALGEFDNRIGDAQKALAKSQAAALRASKADKKTARSAHTEAMRELAQAQQAQLATAALANELEDHIDEHRFLFVVNEIGVPVVYFQCATPDNPDLPRLKRKGKKASTKRGK